MKIQEEWALRSTGPTCPTAQQRHHTARRSWLSRLQATSSRRNPDCHSSEHIDRNEFTVETVTEYEGLGSVQQGVTFP